MTKIKPLSKIKYGDRVLAALAAPAFFADIHRATSLDVKTLQSVLERLHKNGYIAKTVKGQWFVK